MLGSIEVVPGLVLDRHQVELTRPGVLGAEMPVLWASRVDWVGARTGEVCREAFVGLFVYVSSAQRAPSLNGGSNTVSLRSSSHSCASPAASSRIALSVRRG
jgi:hypothetical protein